MHDCGRLSHVYTANASDRGAAREDAELAEDQWEEDGTKGLESLVFFVISFSLIPFQLFCGILFSEGGGTNWTLRRVISFFIWF